MEVKVEIQKTEIIKDDVSFSEDQSNKIKKNLKRPNNNRNKGVDFGNLTPMDGNKCALPDAVVSSKKN